jgi:glycolate oxidase iron-sulfur subunit
MCVHCGFCLQSCPTYLTLNEENDSPRGRLVLMRAMVDGDLAVDDPDAGRHLDRCLGCRACETACPSGVPYGKLLEATRATMVPKRPLPFVARLVLRTFESRALLRLAMFGARLLRATRLSSMLSRRSGRLGLAAAMVEATRGRPRTREWSPKGTGERGGVAILEGCVMEGLCAATNRATERTLQANDYAVVKAPGQQCCGALHAHAGDDEGARRLARVNIAAFEHSGATRVAVNAAGCGAMMKDYAHLLHADPAWAERAKKFSESVRDVTELLADAGPKAGGPVRERVTYDAPCHLLHAQRVAAPPLQVLQAIPELELVPLEESDQCCGSAGLYSLVEPDTSRAVLQRKLGHIVATSAATVATANPGCLMQIGAGLIRHGKRARAAHVVDLLDESYATRDPGTARG